MKIIIAIVAGLIPVIPAVVYLLYQQREGLPQVTKGLVLGLKGFNVIIGLMAAGIGLVWLASPSTVLAAAGAQTAPQPGQYTALAAAIATGLATVGAGIAVSGTGAAAVGAIAEKPESFGRSLIFVGLAEGIAIYGLIIAFLLLNQ